MVSMLPKLLILSLWHYIPWVDSVKPEYNDMLTREYLTYLDFSQKMEDLIVDT